jgi:hypothetical protein
LHLIGPYFRHQREKAIADYKRKLGMGLATDNLTEILKAASDGRVETLFVPVNRQTWGNFDEQSRRLQIHKNLQPGDQDLLSVSSTKTLIRGGQVFVVLPEEMPNKASVAAVMKD